MKNSIILFLVSAFCMSCVDPEDPIDGLSKNLPVIVNTNAAFTFTLKAENFTAEEHYNLVLTEQSPVEYSVVLIVTDFASRAADSSYIDIFNSDEVLLTRYNLRSNLNVTTVDTIDAAVIPNKVFFKADDFSGFIQLVLAIGD